MSCQRFLYEADRMTIKNGRYYCPECGPVHSGMIMRYLSRFPIIGYWFRHKEPPA